MRRRGCPPELALAHLRWRLHRLHPFMQGAIAARDASARALFAAGALGSTITRGHVDALLAQLRAATMSPATVAVASADGTDEEAFQEQARALDVRLPLLALGEDLGLEAFEVEVLVLCSAIEVDSEYERVFAYLQDDLTRTAASVELASNLTASSLDDRARRRRQLGPHGRLRRLGLVRHTARDSGARDELRVSPACVEALLGAPLDLRLVFRDDGEPALPVPAVVAADRAEVDRAARALAADRLDVIGVWGRGSLVRDVVAAIGGVAALPVRRLTGDRTQAISAAASLGALLWIDLDAFGETPPPDLVECCIATDVPIVVTGVHPWRPSQLLAARRFVEIAIAPPDQAMRTRLWTDELPEVARELLVEVSSTFHFDATEVRATAQLARSLAALHTNGHVVTTSDSLRAACLAVARKHGERHTTLVVPRRRADDLVLAPDLHALVLDLVHNFRALPRVMTEWGFGRRVSGGGLKGLFTGEPGTGKTLAAEVVANELGLPMLRVDLARVVSKWIGETEKNLDLVFTEARDSHALLFFDEAEALFGARGDVRHGTDRYANLEVSYLLQRFEDHGGIVILATNLRDKIDPAFMRRFHVVVGFPRPAERERRKIWQRVFGDDVPTSGDLDFAALARLDLTGAGIVAAAQSAALYAARDATSVTMHHVVRGLVRQYQREARVLSAHDLGTHAVHMKA